MTTSTAAATVLASVTVLAWAQGAGQPQNPPPQAPETSTTVRPTTTLAGCLYREDQVPGRKPNIPERAGILEDYILADASVAGTQTKPGATPDATGTTGSTTLASGNMYKVEGPPDEQLKALVGKRVEVTGRISPERGPVGTAGKPRPDQGLGPDEINLPELEATSTREIAGTCPPAPAPRK
jgi:hypothetical protein